MRRTHVFVKTHFLYSTTDRWRCDYIIFILCVLLYVTCVHIQHDVIYNDLSVERLAFLDFTIGRVFLILNLISRRSSYFVGRNDSSTSSRPSCRGLWLEGIILGWGRFFKILIVPLNCLHAIGASVILYVILRMMIWYTEWVADKAFHARWPLIKFRRFKK